MAAASDRPSMKRSVLRSFLLATLAGAAIWSLSPSMTGHVEPWDAGGLYYTAALALGGCLCGSIAPKPLWPLYVGCVVGQTLYLLGWLPTGPLLPVGLVFVLLCSLVFLAGAYVVSRARTRWQARKQQPPRGGA
ncbi:hypothetical protein CXK99_00350 [Stutzerimonas stutzeri]|uniref:Uncharacterized protein n=2 Tax=Stutzerimonas stutzeri TaxID=316 RepID=A0A2N8RJG2_STUST|nr:hypothetical protein [Stutzerimonas stutzeri]MCQ4252536.1 hypothetical protein [Stutzerimonas stutzeri]PNF61222.1 hypothetical protein CXK99_00350 [Stutzerimonas stutzeri]